LDIVELPPLGRRVEGPTIALAIFIYGWWGLTTWFWRDLPVWALVPLGAWVIAWQMNLQHEVIHGIRRRGGRSIRRSASGRCRSGCPIRAIGTPISGITRTPI
jgi:hypothetical protein